MFMLDCLRPVERQWRDLLLLVWKIIRHYMIFWQIYTINFPFSVILKFCYNV